MKKYLLVGVLGLLLLPAVSFALTRDEITLICTLIGCTESQEEALMALADNRNQSTTSTTGSEQGVNSCVSFSENMYIGVRGAEVRDLQEYLRNTGDFTYPRITGYYGPATEQAVKKWQARNGVVSRGTPNTTGYGVVGPSTRAAMQNTCGAQEPVEKPEMVEEEEEDEPSISFSRVSSGKVIGSYSNLPSNSQIRFVMESTGKRYDAQSTMIRTGGSGSLSIPVPDDLANGSYYLTVANYYSPNDVIAKSDSFKIGSDVQTKRVKISSFKASPSSVRDGGAVLFTWSSNLTENDIEVYGGFCNISAVTSANQQIDISGSNNYGASGSLTYVPALTATYTLTCSSGAKDGSPIDTEKIIVDVKDSQSPVDEEEISVNFDFEENKVESGQNASFELNGKIKGRELDIAHYRTNISCDKGVTAEFKRNWNCNSSANTDVKSSWNWDNYAYNVRNTSDKTGEIRIKVQIIDTNGNILAEDHDSITVLPVVGVGYISLETPSGGEKYENGDVIPVRWSTDVPDDTTVTVNLLDKHRGLEKVLFKNVPALADVNWKIPDSFVSQGTSAAYRVEVICNQNGRTICSDIGSSFTIQSVANNLTPQERALELLGVDDPEDISAVDLAQALGQTASRVISSRGETMYNEQYDFDRNGFILGTDVAVLLDLADDLQGIELIRFRAFTAADANGNYLLTSDEANDAYETVTSLMIATEGDGKYQQKYDFDRNGFILGTDAAVLADMIQSGDYVTEGSVLGVSAEVWQLIEILKNR